MKNKGLIATIVVLIAVIITLIAVVFLMQMPTILSVDGWASKFLNTKKETTTIVSTTEVVTTTRETETETTTKPAPKQTTKIEHYVGNKDHVNIDYPQIEGMDDKDLQAKINEKIKTNALSIVPLYPISTALQTLNVSCEVKSFNDSYITIIYEGRVVGKIANSNASSGAQNNVGNRSVAGVDPYLDGFVDPLAGYNQFNQFNQFNAAQGLQPQNPQPQNPQPQNPQPQNPQTQNSQPQNPINRSGTSDGGPSVKTITSPTAKGHTSTYIERTAENSPIYNNSYYGNNPNNTGSRINTAPTDSGNNQYNYPVYGHTSVSTIDQKIYYTNVVDLRTGLDMSLSDYVTDLEKLSEWLRSSKVEFTNVDEKDRKKVREYVNLTVQSRYLDQMKNADFRNKGLKQWPKIFSYRDADGTVYFSVKLSSKLGNYAIVKYKP